MYALMKANLFLHFPGHVIKYWEISKRRKKNIDKYLKLQQEGWEAMIAWSLNPFSQFCCMQYDQKYIPSKKKL